MNPYISLADKGKNNWWRYLLSVIVIFLAVVIGGIPSAINQINNTSNMELNYTGLMISFVFLILGIFLSIRLIHKRKFITLLNTSNKVNWKHYFYGFGVTMAVLLGVTGLAYLWHPDSYRFTLSEWTPGQFMTMLLLSLLFIPIQTAAEELFFRGYLLQCLGRKIKNTYILLLLSSVVFAMLHLGNPEVSKGLFAMFSYLVMGLLLALVTLKSNGLELSMGIHCANNLFAAAFVGMADSVLNTRTVLFIDEWDTSELLIGEVVLCVVLYIIMMRYIRKDSELISGGSNSIR